MDSALAANFKYSEALGSYTVKCFRAWILIGAVWLLLVVSACGQVRQSKVYLLKDTGKKEWCAFTNERSWKAAVKGSGSMSVGTLIYSDGHLSKVDVTETDESGDWIVYDHYFLDGQGQPLKVLRFVNVLPGDRSVLQTFTIGKGKAIKTGTTVKQLSTGKPLTAAKPIWLPKSPIETRTEMFPFYALLRRPDLKSNNGSCVQIRDNPTKRNP